MQSTFANKTLIQTYPLYYSQAVLLTHLPPLALCMCSVCCIILRATNYQSGVFSDSNWETEREDEKQIKKQAGLWTNGNGSCASPLSVTQRKELLTCVCTWQREFQNMQRDLAPIRSVCSKMLCPFADIYNILHAPYSPAWPSNACDLCRETMTHLHLKHIFSHEKWKFSKTILMRIRELLIDLCHDIFYLGYLLFRKTAAAKGWRKKKEDLQENQ